MKKMNPMLKYIKASTILLFMTYLISGAYAQETEEKKKENPEDEVQTLYIHSRPLQRVGNTFESTWLIDNQTVLVPLRKTFQFDILHRFGTVNNGYSDFWGLYAPSNIRLGFAYTPINNLMVGFGFTKFNLLWDFNAKYAILKEQGPNPKPVSLTYFVNMAVDTRPSENFTYGSDRWSYFHQIMLAKKLNRDVSVQGSLNFSHFNAVEAFIDPEGDKQALMRNDHFSFTLLGRYKVSDALSFIGNYDQPLTQHPTNNPNPNVSLGLELATPLHAFQVFVGNYQWIVPQYNNVFNRNNYEKGQFLIGFNITRLLDVKEENLKEMVFKEKKGPKRKNKL
ncbi:DUF5777 family beta-barrel protein [Aquiflexum lacus]|uniref:DUF5777 family beta-barrel protein n=1 Tax=Aquiflexum lacus TaxID=2483805 RepID=UPI0018951213|nr:DUF5777 family beta-barrel protein [Aquiflexum lacus]